MKQLLIILSILWTVNISGKRSLIYNLDDAPIVISRMIKKHLVGLGSSLSKKNHLEPGLSQGDKMSNMRFYLQSFLFRIQPFVSFDLGVANLKISPFFEVRVKRSPPKGWQPYTPRIKNQ